MNSTPHFNSKTMHLRQLSSLEKYFYQRSNLNLHSCFYVSVILNELPPKQHISHALKKTIAKFPHLRCNIIKDDKEIYFKDIISSTNPLYFDDIVEYKEWESLTEENINSIFKTYSFPYFVDKPLWKLIVVPKTDQLLLLLDHLLFDGMSAVNIWQSIMSEIPTTNEHLSNDDVIFSLTDSSSEVSLGKQHPYESWPVPLSWKLKRTIVKVLFYWFPYSILSPSPRLLHFKDYSFPKNIFTDNSKPNKSIYELICDNSQYILHIGPRKISTVLEYCKKNKFSLTAFLSSLFTLSLIESKDKIKNEGSIIKISVPMNTRNICKDKLQLPEKDIQLGNLIAGLDLLYDNDQDHLELKQLATNLQGQLITQSITNFDETMNNMKLLDIADTKKFMECKVTPKPGEDRIYPASTFEVTNLGNQDFKSNSKFIVKDVFFNQPQGTGETYSYSIISTKNGGLNCCVSYPKPLADVIESSLRYVNEILAEF